MIRWLFHHRWLPISVISGAIFLVTAGFELLNSNILGLIPAFVGAGAVFLSKRFSWYSIGVLPVASYLIISNSVAPLAYLVTFFAVVFLNAFFGTRNQRITLMILGIVSAGILAAFFGYSGTLLQVLLGFQSESELTKVNSLLIVFFVVGNSAAVAYVLGRIVFIRLRHIGSPLDIAQSTIKANELQLEISKQNERLEIAKDLSEQLVQRVSAVVSISEGGRYSIVADPDSAGRVLERTYDAGRAAQAELRRLYDYLNSAIVSDVESFRISDLEELAVAYRELGFNTVIAQQGQDFSLNDGMELCVYKIVFEALKNVSKHAPIGTDVDIDFLWVEDGLQVLVKDNGVEVANRLKRNIGELVEDYSVQDDLEGLVTEFDGATLSALRDRAAIYKGRIEATKVPGVGFTLSAIFPNLKSHAVQDN